MKLQLAESVGLTEKQVSGWFCHRRSKEKKLPMEETNAHIKQDRSSGVIQDCGSGLKQDSCGSTKQWDQKHCDPREVESRRLTSKALLPPNIRCEVVGHHSSRMDDTSSGSSSPLQNSFPTKNMDQFGVAMPRHLVQKEKIMALDSNSVKKTGPSGYLKVKGQVENEAIRAVKKQLGRQFQADGPTLGVEFEPLPPGAFETSAMDPVDELYYAGEPSIPHSLDSFRTSQQPNAGKMCERYNSKNFQSSDFEEASFKTVQGSKHRENNPYTHVRRVTESKFRSPFPSTNAQIDVSEESAGDQRESFEMGRKRGFGLRPDSLFGHHLPESDNKVISKHKQPWLHSYSNMKSKVSRREVTESSPNLSIKRGFPLSEDSVLSWKFAKDRCYEEIVGLSEYPQPTQVKGQSRSGMRVAKMTRNEYIQPQCVRKDSASELPILTSKSKRPTGEMTPSFSEDETAEISSSGE